MGPTRVMPFPRCWSTWSGCPRLDAATRRMIFLTRTCPTERSAAGEPEGKRSPQRPFPLSMVLQACPDFAMFARHGIASWRDFTSVADTVRGAFGISPSAWAEATDVMGVEEACVALAAIVQRSAMIKSPGGYLRNLTEKARAGKFSAWPMLMALWRLQHGQRRQT